MIWAIVALAVLWVIGLGLHWGAWVYALLIAALVLAVVDAVQRQKRRAARVPPGPPRA